MKKSPPHTDVSSFEAKVSLAQILKGGVIMEVLTPQQAKIAEEAGAVAVMAIDKPSEMKVKRMCPLEMIQDVQQAVSIPVMAQCRIGHFVEGQILEALFVDFIDESELLTSTDIENYIDKQPFRTPFISGFSNLAGALRRVGEGAAMVRTLIEGDGDNISTTVSILRRLRKEIKQLKGLDPSELMATSRSYGAPYSLVETVAKEGKLPVPLFASGGITTPADASLMRHLGAESVIVEPEIFYSEDPVKGARAIVAAATYFDDPEKLTKISLGRLSSMSEIEMEQLRKEGLVAPRSW